MGARHPGAVTESAADASTVAPADAQALAQPNPPPRPADDLPTMTNETTQADLAAAAFDIADYEDMSAAELRIKTPDTGASTPILISIAGPEHPARKRIAQERTRRQRAALQTSGRLQLDDPEDDDEIELGMLVASTLGWSGLTMGGQAVPFSAQEARKLYADPKRRWLRDQVLAGLSKRELFIRRSAAAS